MATASPLTSCTDSADVVTTDCLRSVLIADDNDFLRRALRSFLEDMGNIKVCAEAIDGSEAVEQAKLHRPDLILMDFSMPGMNGMEASSAIKTTMPDSRIILFTAYSSDVSEKIARAAGIDLVICKDEGTAALRKALHSVFPDSVALPVREKQPSTNLVVNSLFSSLT